MEKEHVIILNKEQINRVYNELDFYDTETIVYGEYNCHTNELTLEYTFIEDNEEYSNIYDCELEEERINYILRG